MLLLKQKEQICKGKNKGMISINRSEDMQKEQSDMKGSYLCFGRNVKCYRSVSYKIENGPQFQELPMINTNVHTVQNESSLHNMENEHKDINENNDNVVQCKPKLKKQLHKKNQHVSNNKTNKVYTTYKPKLLNAKSNSIITKNNNNNNIVLPYLYSKTPSFCSSSINSPIKNNSYNYPDIEILVNNNNQFLSQINKIKQMLSKPYYK